MAFIKCSGGSGSKIVNGSFTTTTSAESATINCGFKPYLIIVLHLGSGTGSTFPKGSTLTTYCKLFGEYQYCSDHNTGDGQYIRCYPMPTTNDYAVITEISSSGFSCKAEKSTSSLYRGLYTWLAIKE